MPETIARKPTSISAATDDAERGPGRPRDDERERRHDRARDRGRAFDAPQQRIG
jgi:hypothetical protein